VHRGNCAVERLGKATRLEIVVISPHVSGQGEAGRLGTSSGCLRLALQRTKSGVEYLPFALYILNNDCAAKLIKWIGHRRRTILMSLLPRSVQKAVAFLLFAIVSDALEA